MRSLIAVAVMALALAVPFAAAQDRKLELGAPEPQGLDQQVEFLKGTASDVSRKDAVVLVHFWNAADAATTFTRLGSLHEMFAARGLVICAICLSSPDQAKAEVDKRAPNAPYVIAAAKKDDESARRAWIDAFGGSPTTFLLTRSRVVAWVGAGLPDRLDQLVRAVVSNKLDPEVARKIAPFLSAARDAAKSRNFKESAELYGKALEAGGSPVDVGLECWKMMSEQANDAAGAKAFLRKTIDTLSKDRGGLAEAIQYVTADPSVRKHDIESAKYAAGKLKELKGSMDDPDCLAALATLAAAEGDFKSAADMQYSAYMAAIPQEKAALRAKLRQYEQKAGLEQPE